MAATALVGVASLVGVDHLHRSAGPAVPPAADLVVLGAAAVPDPVAVPDWAQTPATAPPLPELPAARPVGWDTARAGQPRVVAAEGDHVVVAVPVATRHVTHPDASTIQVRASGRLFHSAGAVGVRIPAGLTIQEVAVATTRRGVTGVTLPLADTVVVDGPVGWMVGCSGPVTQVAYGPNHVGGWARAGGMVGEYLPDGTVPGRAGVVGPPVGVLVWPDATAGSHLALWCDGRPVGVDLRHLAG